MQHNNVLVFAVSRATTLSDRRLIEVFQLESVVRVIPSTFAFLALMVKRIKPKIDDWNLIGTPR